MATVNLGRVKPIYKGEYASGTTYEPLDFVSYDGISYFCILESTGNPPSDTTYWQLVADAAVASAITYTPEGTGAVATTVQDKLREIVSVFDFMSAAEVADVQAGTLLVDVTIAIQNALSSNAGSIYFPAGKYKITSELGVVDKNMIGDGQYYTHIVAMDTLSSICELQGRITIRDIFFDGGTLATNCITVNGANGSLITSCRIEHAKKDGVKFLVTGNNIDFHLTNNLIRIHGTTYSTGTASSVLSGGFSIVTITGAVDLTTIVDNKRSYFTPAGQVAHEIVSSTTNTLTVYPALSSQITNSAYSIRTGSCVLIDRQGNNGKIVITGNIFQNALAGINDQSLYGCTSIANIFEVLTFGIIVGFRGNGSDVVHNPSNMNSYFEGCSSYDIYWAFALNASSIGKTENAFNYFAGVGTTINFYTPAISTGPISGSSVSINGPINSGTYIVNTSSGAQNLFIPVTNAQYFIMAHDSDNSNTASAALVWGHMKIYELYDSAGVFTWNISGGYVTVSLGARVGLISVLRIK